MITKYNPEIHKRKSLRLKGYDYSQSGLYFIPICVHNRECLFGTIKEVEVRPYRAENIGAENVQPLLTSAEIMLSDAGKFANQCWLDIPKHFPNVELHEHIIMPNHIHGIVEIIEKNVGAYPYGAENIQPIQQNKFRQMIPQSIGSIVKGFKIGITKWFRENLPTEFPKERFIWQRNYYEHIIRNEESYQNIAHYILNNPSKWQEDRFLYAIS